MTSRINTGRLLLGTLVAGAVIFVIEGAMVPFYRTDMYQVLQDHNLSMDETSGMIAGVLISLLVALGLMFFYVAARPRFGAGPKTALLVATVMFVTGYLAGLIAYWSIGLYPNEMLLRFGVQGLVEMNLAALAGAWLYRE